MRKILCLALAVCMVLSCMAVLADDDIGVFAPDYDPTVQDGIDSREVITPAPADGTESEIAVYTCGGDLYVPYNRSGAQRLADLGLLYGTGDGFALDEAVTRAQAAVMVLRLMGEEKNITSDTEGRFADMAGHWARDAVAYAYKLGYINGASENTFEPERGVTGRELVKMILSAMKYEGITIENAYDKAVSAALLVNNYTKAAAKNMAYMLNRNDMVNLCSSALLVNAGEKMLKDILMEKGVFTEKEFTDVMMCALPARNPGNSFAWNMNMQMPQDKNYMFSPLSIKIALAMAANGAEGETQKEILDALAIDDIEEFNAHIKELMAKYEQNEDVKLRIANSIWLNNDYDNAQDAKFSEGFAKLAADYFGADVGTVTNADAVGKVNGWVAQKTNDKIKGIISDPKFLTALVNAVYFKGTWLDQFKKGATEPAEFTSRDGSKKEIDFMNQTEYFGYYEDDTVKMVRLPYEDRDIAMYIALEAKPRTAELDSYADKMQYKLVDLSIPKFKIEYEETINDMLETLGISKAFDWKEAKFLGMLDNFPVETHPIYISQVLHKTYIDVDENGTEAAAVTAIIMEAAGALQPPQPVSFVADKPFTYFIYDEANKEILFMGEYAYAD